MRLNIFSFVYDLLVMIALVAILAVVSNTEIGGGFWVVITIVAIISLGKNVDVL